MVKIHFQLFIVNLVLMKTDAYLKYFNVRQQIEAAVAFHQSLLLLLIQLSDEQINLFDALQLAHLLRFFPLLQQLNLFLGHLVRLLTEALLLIDYEVNVLVIESVVVVCLELFGLAFDLTEGWQRNVAAVHGLFPPLVFSVCERLI